MGYHLLTTKDAAAFLDISEKTLEGWRSAETGPKFYRMGGRLVRYFRSDLEDWLRNEQQPAGPSKKPRKATLGLTLPEASDAQ